MRELLSLGNGRGHSKHWPLVRLGLLGLLTALSACQPQHDQAANTVPPVGHYEGSLMATGQPAMRAALDIRHPSRGHYEAELTVPTASTLGFVADTIFFRGNQLRITRPARPGQVLTLTLDGDFWRGTLALDSVKIPMLLVKRGTPTPSTYRVEEVPQANGPAWLFAPADTGTPGPAVVLLPTTETAPTAALWADALVREGIIVLLLPAADSATATVEAPRLHAAFRLLRGTTGADTANIGAWVTGLRAGTLAQVVMSDGAPRVAFIIAQNADFDLVGRDAFRALAKRKLPLLGLYSGRTATPRAAALRHAASGRQGAAIRIYRAAGADLLVPGGVSPRLAPGLPGDVMNWLRER